MPRGCIEEIVQVSGAAQRNSWSKHSVVAYQIALFKIPLQQPLLESHKLVAYVATEHPTSTATQGDRYCGAVSMNELSEARLVTVVCTPGDIG